MQLPPSWHQECDRPNVPPARRSTILIVADDAELRALYRAVFEMEGYAVVAVEDGVAALQYIEAEPPGGIVLDLGLPRLSGQDVQREVAAHLETRDIPIVVVTGRVLDDLDPGEFACVLRKPIDVDDVVAAARRCFPPPRRSAG